MKGRLPAYRVEERVVWPNGSVHWLETYGRAICDADRRVKQLVGVVIDITERKRAEDERFTAIARFKKLIDEAPIAIGVSRSDDIVYGNPCFLELFGAPDLATVQELTVHKLIAPNSRESFAERTRRRNLGLAIEDHYETVAISLDGREFECEVRVKSRFGLNSDRETLVFIEDISARRRAEREILALNATLEQRVAERTQEYQRARDDALTAARAKEQFLSNMSHEIRTPMNGMLGALELLSKTTLDPQQSGYIEVASISGEALMVVINEVLDFAKIGSDQLELAQEPIDVHAVAKSVVTLFSVSAQRKAIELRLDADPSLTVWRIGDSLRLRQVLMNLVGNAIKFTERGQVVVKVDCVGGVQGQVVTFEVIDTGSGIDPSQHEKIFEQFVQASSGVRSRHGGTGLGLSISRQLVRAMGGELTVTSAPRVGSRFRFELCLERAPDLAHSSVAPIGPAAPRQRLVGRVLLVEDNSVNRLIGSEMAKQLGLEVLVAEDGEEALAVLAATKISAVLMDCQMPGVDGFEATIRLRELERLQSRPRTPVIALTASAFASDVERCMAAGMDAHLAKPFNIDQLHTTIAPWIACPDT